MSATTERKLPSKQKVIAVLKKAGLPYCETTLHGGSGFKVGDRHGEGSDWSTIVAVEVHYFPPADSIYTPLRTREARKAFKAEQVRLMAAALAAAGIACRPPIPGQWEYCDLLVTGWDG